ncbi:9474_t:CDS:2, partial [Dentiscutata heterogama]
MSSTQTYLILMETVRLKHQCLLVSSTYSNGTPGRQLRVFKKGQAIKPYFMDPYKEMDFVDALSRAPRYERLLPTVRIERRIRYIGIFEKNEIDNLKNNYPPLTIGHDWSFE